MIDRKYLKENLSLYSFSLKPKEMLRLPAGNGLIALFAKSCNESQNINLGLCFGVPSSRGEEGGEESCRWGEEGEG